MKSILKPILKYYLKIITKLVLFFKKPTIIAIAGSSNKTFTKQEIKKTLIGEGINVRANPKNFNTEIGLPLSILHLPSGYNEYKKWLPAILKAPKILFQKNFPQYLVLSLGTSDPGDMKYLLTIVKPKISIITDITQRYLESFSDMDKLVKEYELLAQKTDPNGFLVLNYDNFRVRSLNKKTKAKVKFFGFHEKSDFRVLNKEKKIEGELIETTLNPGLKIQIGKFGKHNIYAYLISQIIKQYIKNV